MCNTLSSFQRLMDRVRSALKNTFVIVYLHDVVVLSSSFVEHLDDLCQVFEWLRLFKLHVNRVKCSFILSEVKYRGYLISQEEIKPDPAKISAVMEIKQPKNMKQLLTFLQTGSWFRRFVPNYSSVSRPLSNLTKKKTAILLAEDAAYDRSYTSTSRSDVAISA